MFSLRLCALKGVPINRKKYANKLKRKHSKALLKAEYPLPRASLEIQRKNRIAGNDLLEKKNNGNCFFGTKRYSFPVKLIPKISEEFYYQGNLH